MFQYDSEPREKALLEQLHDTTIYPLKSRHMHAGATFTMCQKCLHYRVFI